MKRSLRRAVSLLCVLAMCLSLLPTTAWASGNSSSTENGVTISNGTADNPVTASDNGVTVNKYLSGSGTTEDPYKLTLEAYASNTITTSSKPLDIVLVLDVSGSMEDNLSGGGYQYTEVYKNDLDKSQSYYVWTSDGRQEVSWSEQFGCWYYIHWGFHDVSPKDNENDPTGYQFYTRTWTSSVSKWDVLETAVNGFLESVESQNATIAGTENDHQVALVKFAGKNTDTVGNDTYRDGRYTYNYSQLVCNLTTDISNVEDEFSEIDPAGATSADYGLELAATALSGTNAREDAQQVVIFFTDGEPNHDSGFDSRVANDAIQEAHDLKEDGVTIYTVGIFKGANTADGAMSGDSNDASMNRYMHAVSSNYPDATGFRLTGNAKNMGTRPTHRATYNRPYNAEAR